MSLNILCIWSHLNGTGWSVVHDAIINGGAFASHLLDDDDVINCRRKKIEIIFNSNAFFTIVCACGFSAGWSVGRSVDWKQNSRPQKKSKCLHIQCIDHTRACALTRFSFSLSLFFLSPYIRSLKYRRTGANYQLLSSNYRW